MDTMKIALLGLPQAGKRTLFKLLTGREAPEARKPGEVIEGVARIRDPRVDRLAGICHPERIVYAENRFVLCPDVAQGSAAREWLDAARRCDLLCLVLRAFESDAVYHPDGSVDAERDRTGIESELLLADMATVDTRLARLAKEKRAGLRPDQATEEAALQKCMAALEDGKRLSDIDFEAPELQAVRSLELVTLIPMLPAYNVSEDDVARDFGPGTLTISCQIEEEIMEMDDPAERKEYLDAMGLASSGVDRMNAATYDALGLMSFYTIGKDEARAWTIRKGSPAPTAGGKIHSDIERGFIRVEVIKYGDLLEAGSEKAAKEQGKVQLKGKDYVIEDGDVCHFLFNV
jgi:GTP-binding protein YchF